MSNIKKSELTATFNENIVAGVQKEIGIKIRSILNDVIADQFVGIMGNQLVYDRGIGSFWLYNKAGYFMPVNDMDRLREAVSSLLARRGIVGITMGKLEDIIGQIRLRCPTTDDLDDQYVSFKDCLWSPETGETCPADPNKIATLHVPINFNDIASAECPKFKKYLDETCLDEEGNYNPQMTAQLQEFAGYILWPKIEQVPCLFFFGEGSNGKSVFIDIMRGLVGESRTNSAGLEFLIRDKFGLSSLVGIRFNASDEMGNCRDSTTENFKKMVFGEKIIAQRKFGHAFPFNPKCKFIFCINKMVAFSEVNVAIRRRVMIIPFNRLLDPFKESDRLITIKHLGQIIVKEEMAGVVRWAMEGLARLKKNDFWMSGSEASDEMLRQFEEESSSVIEFLRENYEADKNEWLSAASIYDEYVIWVKKVGRKAVSRIGFGKDFTAVYGKSKLRKVDGKAGRYYHARKKGALPTVQPGTIEF